MLKKILTILMLSILSGITYAQVVPFYVPTSGLVAWYPFTGNAIDSSGHGNNGTVNGATLTTDRFGHAYSAYSFDGTTSNISTTLLPPTGDSARSVSCWFKYNSLISSCPGDPTLCILSYGVNSPNCSFAGANFSLTVNWYTRPPCAIVDGVCTATLASSSSDSIDNNWHLFVATYDPSLGSNFNSIKIYIDGVLKSTTSYNGSVAVNTGNLSTLLIGNAPYSCSRYFNGKIDDIGIWNRALSSCEITNLYLGQNSSFITNPSNDTVVSGNTATFSVTDTFTTATYQWQQNSGTGFTNLSNAGPYSGVTTKTLIINPVTLSMNNYLYRCLRIGGSCLTETSLSASLLINTTAVNSITQNSKIIIAPNPAYNNIVVESDATINKIEITNIIGQKLLLKRYNSNNVTIDLSSFANGVYFIKVDESCVQKFIKQ